MAVTWALETEGDFDRIADHNEIYRGDEIADLIEEWLKHEAGRLIVTSGAPWPLNQQQERRKLLRLKDFFASIGKTYSKKDGYLPFFRPRGSDVEIFLVASTNESWESLFDGRY